MSKFYITTPIYYANDVPHIGHAYTTIAADILARYHRMKGEDVFFLTGTDENAQKNVESAMKKYDVIATASEANAERGGKQSPAMVKRSPRPARCGARDDGSIRKIVQSYVDEMSAKWQATWDALDISHNDFIRTTESRHIEYVKKFWEKVKAQGDIYKHTYEGLYCVGCEAYKTESELIGGLCPDHKRAPEKLSEENYFFRLSKYRDALLKYIDGHPEFIQPESRRNEVVAYIRDHAQDFSISRKNLDWGIPVPGDDSQTIYVWFDALLNYVSANPERWPADLHLVGKDIIKFHCAYWPAMLMSAGMPLPKTVFAHGFFTIDGQKMSKTIGNVIDPVAIAQKYGNDVLRYHIFREIPFGGDGDFSLTRLSERYNGELANGLGNLVARVLSMVEKYAECMVPIGPKDSPSAEGLSLGELWTQYEEHMQNIELDRTIELVLYCVHELDKYIDTTKPWEIAKYDDKCCLNDVLYALAESLRHIGWMLLPFMPETARKIFDQLGLGKDEIKKSLMEAQKWGGLEQGTRIHKGDSLFPRFNNQS